MTSKSSQSATVISDSPIRHVCAMILLAGSVREQPLVRALQRPILGLPLASDATLLSAWGQFARDLETLTGVPRLTCLIATNGPSDMLRASLSGSGFDLRVDVEDVRGTGGAIADIARSYRNQDTLLVASASSFISSPIRQTMKALEVPDADAVVLATPDRAPTGVYLLRCGPLRHLPERGYCDLKEQGLPLLAQSHTVAVRYSEVSVHPITALRQYLAACREYSKRATNTDGLFSVVEKGASVDPSARVVDSVVLAGASIGPRSVIVRSVIAENQVVQPGLTVADELAGTRVA